MTRNAMLQFPRLALVVSALSFGGPLPAGASADDAAQGMEGEIAGVVLDADGQPLAGQRVELQRPTRDGSGQVVTATDTLGRFAYTGLRAGRHKVEIRSDGRVVASSRTIDLSAETMRVTDLVISLQPPPPTLPRARPHVSADRLLRGPPSPTSFDALSTILERGHDVIVTDDGGRHTRGRVSSISSSQLVLVRKRFPFSRPEARGFKRESITTIRIVDATRNGEMLGAAAAAGLLAAFIERDCSPACNDNFGRAGRWMIEAPLFVPIGWSLGRWIDSMINESIYERPQTRRVAISPLIQPARKGLVVQVRLLRP